MLFIVKTSTSLHMHQSSCPIRESVRVCTYNSKNYRSVMDVLNIQQQLYYQRCEFSALEMHAR